MMIDAAALTATPSLPAAFAMPQPTASPAGNDPFAALLATLGPAATPASNPALPAIIAALPTAKDGDVEEQPASDGDDASDGPPPTASSPNAIAIAPAIAALLALPQPGPIAATRSRPTDAARAPSALPSATAPSGPNQATDRGATAQDKAAWQAVTAASRQLAPEREAPVAVLPKSPDSEAAAAVAPPVQPTNAAILSTEPAAQTPAAAGAVRQTDASPPDRAAKAGGRGKTATIEPSRSAARTPRTAQIEATAWPRFEVQPAAALVTGDPAASGTPTDAAMIRTLSVARDGQWLDGLAKDIASTGSGSTLQFRLDPVHLGMLAVRIEHGSDGATVHLGSNNPETRQMLVDAQPRLAAEARAQGLTLKDASVGTNLSDQRPSSHGGASAHGNAGGQTPDDRRPASAPLPIAPAQDTAPTPVTVTVIDDTARYA